MSSELKAGTGEPTFQREIDGSVSEGPRALSNADLTALLAGTGASQTKVESPAPKEKLNDFGLDF